MKEKIGNLTKGNPYLLRQYYEWVRVQSRTLSKKSIKRDLSQKTPGDVVDVLYGLISYLDEDTIRVIKICSILGMKVSFSILLALCRAERVGVLRSLSVLEKKGILLKHPTFLGVEWIFVHELLQKVIYDSIEYNQKIEWHAQAVRQLQKPIFKNISHRYQTLSFHVQKTKDEKLKFVYAKWAALESFSSCAYEESLKHISYSLNALENCFPASISKHRVRILLLKIRVLMILGRYAESKQEIDFLLNSSDALSGIGYLTEALSLYELYLWIKGDLKQAASVGEKIVTIFSRQGNANRYIGEIARLASIYLDMGEYSRSTKLDKLVVDSISDQNSDKKYGLLTQAKPTSLSSLCYAQAEIGNKKKSLLYFDMAYEALEKSKDLFTKTYGYLFLAQALMALDQPEKAIPLLKFSLEYADSLGALLLKPYILSAYGRALVAAGIQTNIS